MAKNKTEPNRYNLSVSLVERRAEMLKNGKLGVKVTEGHSVIVTTGANKEERDALEEHSELLAKDKNRGFLSAKIIRQPDSLDIKEIIIDPEVTSIAFLGDGSFSALNMPQANKFDMERITWYQLAKIATHLKQGIVEVRTCTKILDPIKETRVALPAFIVADQTKIIGTVDMSFATHNGYDVFNNHLGQIYENPNNDTEQLRRPIGFDLPL